LNLIPIAEVNQNPPGYTTGWYLDNLPHGQRSSPKKIDMMKRINGYSSLNDS